MRRITLLLLSFIAVTALAFSQEKEGTRIKRAEWGAIAQAIMAERWGDAVEVGTELMATYGDGGDEEDLGKLRFMMLYSRAGLVTEEKMKHEELVERCSSFIGKRVTLPGLMRESLHIQEEDSTGSTVFVTMANSAGVNIHCMVYGKSKESLESRLASLDKSRPVVMSGILRELQPNPNGSLVWIVRVHLDDVTLTSKE
jgi:hypothetical protein